MGVIHDLKCYWDLWKEIVIKLSSYEVICDHNWSNAERTVIGRSEGTKEVIIKWLQIFE